MLEWDGFRFFLALHRKRTLKAAAEVLKVDQTTVGRRITALEHSLGTQLFEKRSDGYFLTLAGERMLPTIQATEDSLLSVERVVAGREELIPGKVRVAMPGALANHLVIPRMQNLMKSHPGLEIEFLTGPEVLNLARRESDIALRLVKPTQKDLVARKIGHVELALYGHPRLWIDKRKPNRKEDLEAFSFIGLTTDATSDIELSLLSKIQPHLRYSLRSAAWSSVFYAVQAGLGVGILPSVVAERDPKIIRLEIVESVKTALWLVVHPDILQSARVRVVLDFLVSIMR